jgi:hypothetical protein
MKLLLRSFSGGEITNELAGRVDLAKWQTGLALCRNFITLPHGPATRRTGLEFINEAKDSTHRVRGIPFAFSATQTAVLEFGHQYIRFHIDGGTLLEAGLAIAAITRANPGVLTYAGSDPANGDWMYLSGIGGMTQLNGRWVKVANVNAGANTFELTDTGGSNIDTAGYGAYTAGGTASRAYTLATTYASGDLFDLHFAQNSDVITITHPSYPAKELKRLGATNWTLTDVSFAPSIAAPGAPTVTKTSSAGLDTPYEYCVSAVAADGVTESLASPSTSGPNDLSISGNYNTISWSAVPGASRYNVYKRRGGGFGYIGQTTTLSAVDDNIMADASQSPPEDIITLNSGAGDYPQANTYHEQRRWFAGTTSAPQVLWATRTGTESNLTSSLPSRDADGMELRLASAQNNQIRHLIPLSDLIALTQGGEFRIFADGAPAITPTAVSIKSQGYSGASNVQPVVTSGSILYVQAQGSRVRELAYNFENNLYRSIDLSIMAPHRFNGYSIAQLAYSRSPEQIAWAVRNDGTLLGMTYVPEQQVYGWHAHDTDGTFESVCVVAEGNEDVLYAVVKRSINGRDVRYIERMHSRIFTAQADAFFVDSGLTYSGAPATTITGLWHLEGETVDALADGAVVSGLTVTGGAVTLDTAASTVHVGLPYTSDLKTLPLSLEAMQAVGQGTVKNINEVHIRVRQASLVQAGPDFDRLRESPVRAVSDNYGSPPALRSGELSLSIDPSWSQDGAVCIRQDAPVPLTVLSMTLNVQTGG